ncbi:hypothetical protein Cgig2_017993 [Carnegiea gigantea]|uniref:Uncharacterized protein n=1 Tax=Carnegiea gigantea TaxID=171969 RepID=A0A9Q1JQU7_9CARY|nr:hypothetical protein Cgig2_017993 [Carnegiea gigantea]
MLETIFGLLCGGSNPPYFVITGFLNSIWGNNNIDQIPVLNHWMFLVKFDTIENKDLVLWGKLFFFDKKPPGFMQQLLISIKFPRLDTKYWGAPSLGKIGSLLETPIKRDKRTKERKLLNYARLLIKVVEYEWRPVKCTHYHFIGHDVYYYRKKNNTRRTWVNEQLAQVGNMQTAP